MTAYAIAHLRTESDHEEVFTYMERIQATMDPYRGRFLVHGGPPMVLEGDWPGHAVVLAFPDLDTASAWYASDAYRAILPMRADHIASDVILVDGVGPDHDSAAMAADLRVRSRSRAG